MLLIKSAMREPPPKLDYLSPGDEPTDDELAAAERLRRYYREPPSGDGVLYVLAIPVAVAILWMALIAFLVWA
jgi:hypothetical protein